MNPPNAVSRWIWERSWAFRICYTLSILKDAWLALWDGRCVDAYHGRAGVILGFQEQDTSVMPEIPDDPEFTPLLRAMDASKLQDLLKAFQTCQRHGFVAAHMWEHFARALKESEVRAGDHDGQVTMYEAPPVPPVQNRQRCISCDKRLPLHDDGMCEPCWFTRS